MPHSALQPATVLRGHSADVQCVCFHPDSHQRRLYTGDANGVVRIWDLNSTRARTVQAHPRDSGVVHIAFASRAERLVTQGRDGTVISWALDAAAAPSSPRASFSTRSYHFCKMAVAAGAECVPEAAVAVAGEDPACATVWDLATARKVIHVPKTKYGMVMALSFPTPSKPILMVGCDHACSL